MMKLDIFLLSCAGVDMLKKYNIYEGTKKLNNYLQVLILTPK